MLYSTAASRTLCFWLIWVFMVFGLVSGGRDAWAQQVAPAAIRLQPEDLERGLNGQQRNFYFLPPGAARESYQSAGFFGQKLRPYLAGNAEALSYLNQYRRQKALFLAERLVLVGAVGLYGQQVLAGDENQYFNSTQQVAVGVAAVSLLTNIFINRNTNRYMQRAVEAFNAGRTGTLWQRVRPTNLRAQCTPTGQPLLALRWSLR